MTKVVLLSVFVVAAAAVRQPALPNNPGWVGLYSTALIEWLENANRLDALCAKEFGNGYALDRCKAEKMKPKIYSVPLSSGPSRSAPPRGSLLIHATPGEGLRFFFDSGRAGYPEEFEPDLTMQDWGYGPYFHQTYLGRQNDWFALPEGPFPPGTWINARDIGDPPHVLPIDNGDILDSPSGPIVVLNLERDALVARPEQPADMWCEDGDAPPLKPWTAQRIPWRDLYSPTGHLRLSVAYPKGC